MTIARSQIMNIVKDFPKNIEMEDLMYRLYVLEKIESGESDIRKGKIFSHKEVWKRLSAKWQK